MDSKYAAALWLCLPHQWTLRSIDFSWLIKSDQSCVILGLFFVFSHLPSTGSCSLMLPVSKKAAYERARRGTCQCGSREMEWEWFLPCGSTLAKQSLNQTPPTLETYPMSQSFPSPSRICSKPKLKKNHLLLLQWTLFCLLNVLFYLDFFKNLTRLNCFPLLQRDVACLF